ncbi:hypothetical protein CFC21_021725 [Triticum aestivum]|uniref:Uncharacterized protein n=2 Tax=Triticum aestivum TaxID=4565 RepID=A0A9R1J740_WHEAT|nr:hypothetical protein CFC21_021725 [Triticum aestivum]
MPNTSANAITAGTTGPAAVRCALRDAAVEGSSRSYGCQQTSLCRRQCINQIGWRTSHNSLSPGHKENGGTLGFEDAASRRTTNMGRSVEFFLTCQDSHAANLVTGQIFGCPDVFAD